MAEFKNLYVARRAASPSGDAGPLQPPESMSERDRAWYILKSTITEPQQTLDQLRFLGRSLIPVLVSLGEHSGDPDSKANIALNRDIGVERVATDLLVHIGRSAVSDLIGALLRGASFAADALGKIRPVDSMVPYALAALADGLSANDDDVRTRCAQALGELGPWASSKVARLVKYCKQYMDPNAIRALGKIGVTSDAVIDVLRDALKRDSESMNLAVSSAIQGLGPSVGGLVPDLMEAYQKSELFRLSRSALATALGAIGPVNAGVIPFLVRDLGDWSLIGSFNPHVGLSLVGQPAVPVLRGLVSDSSTPPYLKAAAIVTLAAIGSRAIDAKLDLVGALTHEDGRVRGAAAFALGEIGARDPYTLRELKKLKKDVAQGVVAVAREAYRKLRK